MVVEDLFEHVVVQVQDHVGIHLDEAAIGIEGEPAVARQLGQALDRVVVEAEIQHRVHHPGHGGPGARAHGDQQRARGVAKGLAGQPLDSGKALGHLVLQLARIGAAIGVIMDAGLGGDREPWRHRQAQGAHLGQIGALAAQQVLHRGVAVSAAAAKGIDPAVGHDLVSQHKPSSRNLRKVGDPTHRIANLDQQT